MAILSKKQRGRNDFKIPIIAKKSFLMIMLIGFMFFFCINLISASDYTLKEFFDGGKACVVGIPDNAGTPQTMTFTVGGDGTDGDFTLKLISWYLDIGTSDINISVWDVTASNPVGTGVPNLPLYSQTYSPGAGEGWVNFTLTTGQDLVNGTQYAISINEVGDGGGSICRDTTQAYKHGSRFAFRTPDTDEFNFLLYSESGEREFIIDLISPTNGSSLSTTSINFTANYTAPGYSLKNATYSVWYNNGTLFNRTTITLINGISNSTNLSIGSFTLNKYLWNVELCGENATATKCNPYETNNSFTVGVSLTSSSYKTQVFETSRQTFSAVFNVLAGAEIALAQLIYNGTTYPISDINHVGTTLTISKSIDIPLNYNSTANQTNEFNFRFTYEGNSVQNSESFSQTSSFINLILCGNPFNITALNFTLVDETTLLNVNATSNQVTWESTFNYWLGDGGVFKNYSYQLLNTTNQNNFTFCIYPYLPNNYTFHADLDTEFLAVDYSENEYHLRNATLTNASSDINLYLIDSDLSTKFYITVNKGLSFVSGAIVNIAKYIVGEGVYKTTSIKITDNKGEFPMYADLDAKYLFSVVKDGVVLGIVEKTLTCVTAPCEATIELPDDFESAFGGYGEVYAANIYSNLTFNTTSKVVTYTFFDITGLANYFRLHVTQMSFNNSIGRTICNVYSYSSAGTLTCNITGYDGDFIARTYISRSPELLDKVYNFFISDALDTLGLLGIFLNLAIIVTVILATATTTRGSPAAIVFMLGLTILLLKIGGLFPFGWGIVAPLELIIVWIVMKSKG